ncbi:TBC-domain-containing protein [Thozetella sp. PMI_491]|nr:TBC-domain-containing protein [Thozetella sp. PMI_491]
MDPEQSVPLERSISQQSATSIKSHRSTTGRARRRLPSHPSSSASSIAASDKSLVSFPSFDPDSPRDLRDGQPATPDACDNATPASASASRKSPDPDRGQQPRPASIVESLTSASPAGGGGGGGGMRNALFEDAPVSTNKIPGALHHADDEHIERLISRHGAANLIRQIAEDLAHRDAQMSGLRRRAEERERALRKIILECGLSNLDLETRLRAIEKENRANGQLRHASREGLSDLMTDAMAEHVGYPSGYPSVVNDATIRASGLLGTTEAYNVKGTARGWKDYLWGTTVKRTASRASSVNADPLRTSQTVVKTAPASDRRPGLPEDLFNPPEADSIRSPSRASSIHSGHGGRKTSLASLALRLVAGGTGPAGAKESEPRGRTYSTAAEANRVAGSTGSLRTPSVSSVGTNPSARAVSAQGGPKALMAMRRHAGSQNGPVAIQRVPPQERWDTISPSPGATPPNRQESYGPVEMDTIQPPEDQPPTLSHIYNNYNGAEYLTDRFGFIYDQRRKKRQREAAQMAQRFKRGSRTEMLTNSRKGLSPAITDDNLAAKWDVASDGRPGTPSSAEEARDESKPKRWQDYLKIATFPTELLSHTPSISVPGFEVMEGAGEVEMPKSPGLITSEERGFLPSATTTTLAVDSETQPVAESDTPSGTLVKEDAEPVKLLLQQLSEVHDSLQRDKTVRWNDFLRKVRAERKREGEAAAVAAASASEARFQRATAVMPETKLGDGELIGVASLGIQGKIGRAKANEFKNLILGGVPVAYRAKIWSECCGSRALRVPGYYDDLVNRPTEQDDPQVANQIKADITRTLTDNIFFRKGPGVQRLNEVLLAYSRRNIEVGYCQGMNLVTANLLLIMPSAEDAFWVLVSIIEDILPRGYFDHSLLASRADQQVLRQYVAEVLPKLSQHFEDLSIDLETMTFQWFLSVFTDCLSAEALFRVWDVVLCTNDGSTFLFQVALALLKLNEQQLLACESSATVYTYINHQMTNHAISIDGLIQASEGLRRLVRREEVEARRAKAIEAEKELIRQREERNALRRARKATTAPAIVSQETSPPSESGDGEEDEGGRQSSPLSSVVGGDTDAAQPESVLS